MKPEPYCLMKSTGMPAADNYIPTCFAAEALRPALKKLDAELDTAMFGGNHNTHSEWKGALTVVSSRAALDLGIQPDSVPRRIWTILANDSQSVNAKIVDALFLACDIHYNQELELPELPGGPAAAKEMVNAYFDRDDTEDMSKAERRKFTQSLLRFSRGFANGEALCEEGEVDRRIAARKLASERTRAHNLGLIAA